MKIHTTGMRFPVSGFLRGKTDLEFIRNLLILRDDHLRERHSGSNGVHILCFKTNS
jgi:hypothetical protein